MLQAPPLLARLPPVVPAPAPPAPAPSGSGTAPDGDDRFARPRVPAPTAAQESRSRSDSDSDSDSSGSEGAAARLEEVLGRLGERLDREEEEEEITPSQAGTFTGRGGALRGEGVVS